MYFLTKFCRFCVQSDLELNELGMVDFDGVKLSEKMEICLNLINDPVSTHIPYICKTCTNKLRVSYNFLKVCEKSTSILKSYLEKLTVINEPDDDSYNIYNFQNWDVEVAVTAIPRLGIVKTPHSSLQRPKTIDNDNISEPESESESEESDVEMQDTGQLINETVKNPNIRQLEFNEEQTKIKKYLGSQPVYTERRRIGKMPPSLFKDGTAKGKVNKVLDMVNKEPQTIKTEIDYPEIVNVSAVFLENQSSQILKTEVYRLGNVRKNYQCSKRNIDEHNTAQPGMSGLQESRIRVRNFDNEPIQNQSESSRNQNVLSEIEKVVNDVPASFKKQQKTRITKEQRCTLLKQLLESAEKQNKEKNSSPSCTRSKEGDGLKGILSFTENYKFLDKKTASTSSSTDIDKFNANQNHLDKLEHFARDYFKKKSFKEFKDIIMYIIEHKDDESAFIFYDSDADDDENDIFGKSEADDEETDTAEEEGEEMVVEPDFEMKEDEDSESTFDYVVETNLDDELGLVVSSDDEQPNEPTKTSYQKTPSPSRTHRTTPPHQFFTREKVMDKSADDFHMSLPASSAIRPYPRAHCASTSSDSADTQDKVKEEPREEGIIDRLNPSNNPNNPFDLRIKKEFSPFSKFFNSRIPEEGEIFLGNAADPGPSNYSQEFQSYINKNYSSESVNMLDHLVANYPMQKKVFSPLNARCRTKNQPYISPSLMDQFKFQCFRCEKCNRNFKSQGYLKAHASKIH